MSKHIPNPETYRPLLGYETNVALFRLVQKKNGGALTPMGVNKYIRKMIAHWYEEEFGEEFPAELQPYHEGPDV